MGTTFGFMPTASGAIRHWIADLASELPTAAPAAEGDIGYAKDTDRFYIYNGASWSAGAGMGFTTATTAGTAVVGTLSTNGLSMGVPAYLTTADLSQNSSLYRFTSQNSQLQFTSANSNFVHATAAFAGTSASGTIGSAGISVSIGPYITTARASNDAVGLNTALTANGVAWTVNSSGLSLNVPAFLTTAMLSARGSDFVQATAAFAGTNANGTIASGGISVSALPRFGAVTLGGNTAGTTTFHASNNSTLFLHGGANITLSGNGSSITVVGGAGGAAGTFTNAWAPFQLQDGTATTSATLSQLNIQPFYLDKNQSFGQIAFIGIGTLPATSASNSHSARLTNSTQRYVFSTNYTVGNTNIIDLFLFSRGSGNFSTEIETFASTRNSFATNYRATYWGDCTLTNTAGGSIRGSQTVAVTISYPFLTSGQSINGATSHTTWGSGYTTWTSEANNSSLFTISTSAARTLSIGSTFPATLGWSGAKLINMNFATSLSAGEYWLGMLRHSSSSESSSSANSFTGAAGTGNSYSATFNQTAYGNTQQLTLVGKTVTVVNSLGSLGFITTNNMGPECALGSFSGTWASNTTYLNNAANPVGAIALTQIRTGVSFFQSWFQFHNCRIV